MDIQVTKVDREWIIENYDKFRQTFEVFTPILEKYQANKKAIDDKHMKATAALSAVTKVDTQAEDDYAAKLLVVCNNTVTSMETLRKEYTSILRAFLEKEIVPENDLKVKMGAVRALRDARAKRLADEAAAKNKEIDAQKVKENAITEVKRAIKLRVENGMIDRIVKFDENLADIVKNKLTVENAEAITAQLKGIKPKLKESFYTEMFAIDPAQPPANALTPELVKGCQDAAQGYYTYDKVNGNYTLQAKTILDSWISNIPGKVSELRRLAKGGEDAIRLAQLITQRELDEQKERDRIAAENRKTATMTIESQARDEQITTEFKAQVQSQTIERPKGTREVKFYTITPGASIVKISQIVSAVMMNLIPLEGAPDQFVFKKRSDNPEEIEYVAGIQYWLDVAASKVPYQIKTDGLDYHVRLATIARSDAK